MSATDVVLQVLRALERLDIPYMLVGSYSSNYYGRPRSTHDADLVVVIVPDQLTLLLEALGEGFHLDPQLAFETVTLHTRHVITHISTAFRVELFHLTDEPYNQERFSRRRKVDFEGQLAWLPSPEDVIVQKLLWAKTGRRRQDLTDASQVLRVQTLANLDLDYIRRWTIQQGTWDIFQQLAGL